jgi:hypothetical protein
MITDKMKKEALSRSGGICSICGRRNVPLEFDHIIPLSQGGKDTLSNTRVVCRSCHISVFYLKDIEYLKRKARGAYALEERVSKILKDNGLTVVSGATGPDAGVDILAYGIAAKTKKMFTLLIECKWKTTPLRPDEVADFAAKFRDYNSQFAIIVSNVAPTPKSRGMANQFGLRIINEDEVEHLVRQLCRKHKDA